MLETCSLRRRVQEGRADVPLLFSSRQDALVFERGDRRPLMKQNKEEEAYASSSFSETGKDYPSQRYPRPGLSSLR